MARKRKRGSGSLIHRKDGRWEGRYVIGYDEKGLPITKNVLAKSKSACAEKLSQLAAQYAKSKIEKMDPSMTFGAWMVYWYQACKRASIRPTTQSNYEQRIYGQIIPALGEIPLNKLTQGDLQHFYTELKKNGRRRKDGQTSLSDATVRGCHMTCRSALDAAVDYKLIYKNPANDCKFAPAKKREMQTLTVEEMQRLLIQAKEDCCFEILLLELSTGLRRAELCGLQWRDLNMKTGQLHIERQIVRVDGKLTDMPLKTDAARRTLMLPAPLLHIMAEYRKTVFSRWMFPSPRLVDSPRDPATLRTKFSKVLERAECKHVRFHDLRHTFATTALAHGMDIKTLSTIIGHASASTTLNVYAHLTDEMRLSAAAKIDKGIAKAEGVNAATAPQTPRRSDFKPYKGQRRKPGTGCVSQINEKLWEGRYSPHYPDGTRHIRNVYAKTREECEVLLAKMIQEMNAEIAELRAG